VSIDIKTLTLGLAVTNCYIVGDTSTHEAIVIDPVDDAPRIFQTAKDAGWKIKLILATHEHFDHVLASKPLKELTGAPFYIHEKGVPWLEQLPQQGIRFVGQAFPDAATPDHLFTDESEEITLGAIRLETLYTPGHAPGHVAFFMREQNTVFGGDCLFAGSIGRTDLPNGNQDLLMRSIFEKLIPLGDNVKLLAGHMHPTTIGNERKTNPFLIEYAKNHR